MIALADLRKLLPTGANRSPKTMVRAISGAVGLVCAVLTVWTLVAPRGLPPGEIVQRSRTASIPEINVDKALASITGRALFEPAIPLPARGATKKHVEDVRKNLSRKAIMEIDGRLVVYIRVLNEKGLSGFFHEGEGVEELFTVTRIRTKPAEVEVSIAGERIKLE